MNSRSFNRFTRWLNLPTGVLMALLQRSPALKIIAAVGEYVVASPIGTILKGTVTAAASLGAVNSLAGATTLSTTPNSPSPIAATVGTPVNINFSILGTTSAPESWTVGGTVPAGLAFYTNSTGTTGGVTSGNINASSIYLRGTPTTAGAFSFTLRAFNDNPAYQTNLFTYAVNVTGSAVTAPTITADPMSQTVAAGGNVTFSVTATGTGLMYQWQKAGAAIAGQTNATLSLTNVQAANAGGYSVVVSNGGGSVTSATATLTVTAAGSAPVLTANPLAQTVAPGGSATFTVGASGTGLSYQWQKNGANIAGATNASLTLNNLQGSDAGDYSANVTNTGGTTSSFPATLTVATPVAGRLVNLSVRTTAGSGAATLTAGFIIGGSGNKSVVVRGTGQTLTSFGLTGVLPNPLMTLAPLGQPTLLTNDSWNAAPNLATLTTLGYTSFGSTPLDARDTLMLIDVPAGGYTAQLTDVGGSSGLGLIEVFDTDNTAPGSPGFDAQPRLNNLSARAQVNTGSGVLIAGFACNGTAPHRLLIRATGPSLVPLGVSGVLADTKLELRRFSDAKLFAENDDWGTALNLSEIVAANGDKLASMTLNAKESVMLVTVASGNYTAIVSGLNGGTGVALLEIYELP